MDILLRVVIGLMTWHHAVGRRH